MAGINYDPMGQFIGGLVEGRDSYNENKRLKENTDYERIQLEKKAANDEIQSQIDQVTEILRKTNDPAQREAVLRTLAEAKKVYSGAYYQKLGIDARAAKMFDFAAQTPYEESGKQSSDPYAATYAREKAKLDAKAAAAPPPDGSAAEYKKVLAGNALTDIQTARKILADGEGKLVPNTAAGVIGQFSRGIEASQAGRLESLYSQLRSKEAFRELQRLKDASETGATGLGPIALKEFEALQQATARLSTGLPYEDQIRELEKLDTAYTNLIDLANQYEQEVLSSGDVPVFDESMLQDIVPVTPPPPLGAPLSQDMLPSSATTPAIPPKPSVDYITKYGLEKPPSQKK